MLWYTAPKMGLQLGERWAKGLHLEGSRGQMFRCSSGKTTHRIYMQMQERDGLSVTRVRGVTGGLQWKHLIIFTPRWACLSQLQTISLLLAHVSFFASLHSFSLSFSPSCLTCYPSLILLLLHPLLEGLSSELSRSFIKEISLKPSNYYGKRKKQRRKGGHSGKRPHFIPFPWHFSPAQMCTYNLHFPIWEDRDMIFLLPMLCVSPLFLHLLSISLSVSLSVSLSLSLPGWVLIGFYGSPIVIVSFSFLQSNPLERIHSLQFSFNLGVV